MLRSVQMLPNAAKNRGAAKPPGGRRVSKVETAQRLDHADRMLREARPRAEIVASMRATFGMSERAADSYIAKARDRWVTESKDVRDVERAASLARLERLSHKAEQRGAFAAAVSAEKLRAQINGLLAPVEVKATLASPAAPPEMTYEQAIEELEALGEVLELARPKLLKSPL